MYFWRISALAATAAVVACLCKIATVKPNGEVKHKEATLDLKLAGFMVQLLQQTECNRLTLFATGPVALEQDSSGAAVHILTQPDCQVQLYVRHWDYQGRAATLQSEQGAAGTQQQAPAVLLLVHGLNWHSAYYAPAAQQLRDALAVVAMDLPGYGRSGSATGIRGYHPTGLAGYADSIKTVVQYIQQELHPRTPIFLLGESMGGAAVLHMLQHLDASASDVHGAIIMAATSEVPADLLPHPIAIKAYCLAGRLFPGLPDPAAGRITDKQDFMMAFGDEHVAAAGWDDPLVPKQLPIGQMAAVLPQMLQLPAAPAKIHSPILVLHGTADTRVLPELSERLLDRLGSEDKTLITYDGARHMLFLDRPEVTKAVVNDIKAWVSARVD